MKTFKVSILLLIFVLNSISYSSISYVKTYPGYKLKDSLGRLNNVKDANIAVQDYLKSHKKDLRINAEDLQLKTSYFSCGNFYLIYEQYHSGLLVHRGKVGVKVKVERTIKKIDVRFHYSILAPFSRSIARSYAINIAKNMFKDYFDEPVKVEWDESII